jgi:hypothetical protein
MIPQIAGSRLTSARSRGARDDPCTSVLLFDYSTAAEGQRRRESDVAGRRIVAFNGGTPNSGVHRPCACGVDSAAGGDAGHPYASYNGVRSDSVQFFFPAACRDQDHLYHGRQVNNQVPPL